MVGKQVADFLDLHHVIETAADEWFQRANAAAGETRVLVAESSPFSRGLIRSGLDMAGYHVIEAADLDDALRRLEQQPVHVVLTSLGLPPRGGSALLSAMQRRPDWQDIPIVGLADSAEQIQSRPAGLRDCQLNSDREAMLQSVARLAAAVEGEPVRAGFERQR